MSGVPGAEWSVRRLSAVVGVAGRWVTVELCGELDAVTARVLVDRVGRVIAQEVPPRVALLLSGVGFCDSSGINAFVQLSRRAQAAGGELVLVGPGSRLVEMLRWTGLEGPIRVFEVLAELPEG
ncbi:STAS domain-containing protein [Actinomadura geliboluensis]|uniref:STAS domain-containing protein n=1 Tax=Actinomadura geliboluensis TaxID=882440 RepID=UPI002625A2B8|nr:STAS domain-containing protein [Actinomadura geliboluensis]